MGEVALAGLVGASPLIHQRLLKAAHGLLFGDTGVGDAVHMAGQQSGFVLRRQVAVVGHALVKVVGHQIEQVFLQIGPGAGDGVDFVAADHLGQRQAQFGRGHGPGQGDQHRAAGVQMALVAVGGVDHRRGVEVAIVVPQEAADGSIGHWSSLSYYFCMQGRKGEGEQG